MSKTYLVAYDFPGSSEKYSELFNELKDSPRWWHYIDAVWLLITDESADEIFERLEPYLDDDISLFITEIGNDHQGWLPDRAWKWIRKHVTRKSRSKKHMQPTQ